MTCSLTCLKWVLFSFNFIFWLGGLGIMGVGVWTKIDPGNFDSFLGGAGYAISAYIMMATGALVVIVGFLGCYGAVKENRVMLASYFVFLVLIFCAEVAAGILGFIYREKVEEEIRTHVKKQMLEEYGFHDHSLNMDIDRLQSRLKCCGADNYTDWNESNWKQENLLKIVPPSCCKKDDRLCYKVPTFSKSQIYERGCIDELKNYVLRHMLLLGIIGCGIACIQLLGMIFACCLFCSINV